MNILPLAVFVHMAVAQVPSEAVAANVPLEFSVPFGCGLTFAVSQAHAVGSHLDHDRDAWDFRMPEGVPITAAAAGVVRLARGDSVVGGCDPRFAADSNYVVITHPSGFETQYLHFQKVFVKPGELVQAGQMIGLSGKTGWACGSHLHFKVARPTGKGWNNPSVPARFWGYGDPQTGTWVAAPACVVPRPDTVLAERKVESPGLGGTVSPQKKGEQVNGPGLSRPSR